ncbi:MAG: DNA repair protein RecO [Pseudomonadota bacterium]
MNRVLTPAFVLHRRNFEEASLLVELLTRDRGRLGAVARGARKSRRHRGGLLQPYVPLQVSLSGRGQLATLGQLEAEGPPILTVGSRPALIALYLNELLLRLTARDDPNETLFQCYLKTLVGLATGAAAPVLRRFELALLASQGYAVALTHDAVTGEPVQATQHYRYEVEEGPVATAQDSAETVRGETLLCLARGEDGDAAVQREARQLLGEVLRHYLGPKPLRSRQLYQQMIQPEIQS